MPANTAETEQTGRRRRPYRHGLPAAARSFVGYVSLAKAGGPIVYRSALERDALAVLALDHAVARIERADYSEVERAELDVAERPHASVFELPELGRYTPDLRLTLDEGSIVFVEIGFHSAKVEDEAMFRRLQAAAVEAARTGCGFLILTERVLR